MSASRRGRGSTPAAGSSSHHIALLGAEKTAQHISEAITQSVPVLGLLGAQLGHVVDTTETAALGFLTDMQSMDAAAAGVVTDAGTLADLAAEHVSEVAEISEATTAVIETLVDFIARRDQAVTDLVDEVRGLSSHVVTIQNIARSTTMLALNAKIEASRAGDRGAGFQVVADEVRDLSRQSDVAARDIGQQIEQLARRLDAAMDDRGVTMGSVALGTDGVSGAANDQAIAVRLRVVADEQRRLAERLTGFAERVESQSHGLVAASATVHQLSTSMMGGLQFQDVTRQVIEHVVSSLDDLGVQFDAAAGVLAGREDVDIVARLDEALERIRAGYVMKQQRITHAETVGTDWLAPEEPLIELF